MFLPLLILLLFVETEAFLAQVRAGNGLCWDSQTVAFGAMITLKRCNNLNPTQVFNVAQTGRVSKLQINGRNLCINFSRGNVILANCVDAAANQLFTIGSQVTTVGNNCVGTTASVFGNLGAVNCGISTATTFIRQNTPPVIKVPLGGYRQLRIDNLCIQGGTGNSVRVAACTRSSFEQWYFSFGFIRNVATGACLSYNGLNPRVTLVPCDSSDITQAWLIDSASRAWPADGQVTSPTNCMAAVNGNLEVSRACSGTSSVIVGLANIDALPPSANPRCASNVRKDFRDLTPAEREKFFADVQTLRRTPSLLGNNNRYFDYSFAHGTWGGFIHNQLNFLPWHRYFLTFLEHEIRVSSGNQAFTLPYWSWSTRSSLWSAEAGGFLNSTSFGSTGVNNRGNCVRDGHLSSWSATDGPCIRRSYTPNTDPYGFATRYNERGLLALISNNLGRPYTNMLQFSDAIDSSAHGTAHVMIGDNNGRVTISVNDLLFFMHHGNVDRYYAAWQRLYPRVVARAPAEMFAYYQTDAMPGFSVKSRLGVDYVFSKGCFIYRPYSLSSEVVRIAFTSNAPISVPGRRDTSMNRRDIRPLPQAVVDYVQRIDSKFRTTISHLDLGPEKIRELRKNDPVIEKDNKELPDWWFTNMKMTESQKQKVLQYNKDHLARQLLVNQQYLKCLKLYFNVTSQMESSVGENAACVKISVACVATGNLIE